MNQVITYAEYFRPVEKSKAVLFNIIAVLAGSLLIALSAQVCIYLPFSPVPVTGQTLAVLVVGALLGSRLGTFCILTYIMEGLCGLPVFSAGRAGLIHMLGPTGGYMIGFVFAGWITGFFSEMGWDRSFIKTVFSMILGLSALYVVGVGWLSVFIGTKQAVLSGLLPFLPGAAAKVILASALLPVGWKLMKK